MIYIALYLGLLALGYFLGSKLRRPTRPSWPGKGIMVVVMALVFLMGLRIGMDEGIVTSIGQLGFMAIVMTIAALVGSVGMAYLLRISLKLNREGVKK